MQVRAVTAGLLVLSTGIWECACGAAPEPMGALPAVAAPQPSSVEQAISAIDVAQREIESATGGPIALASPGFAAPPPAPAAVAPNTAAEAGPRAMAKAGSAASKDKGLASEPTSQTRDGGPDASACTTACVALGHMTRATEHLCALAGPGDARCKDAGARLQAATFRVHAACPACSN